MNEIERQSLKNQQAILNGLLFVAPQGVECDEIWKQSEATKELLNPKESNTEQRIKKALNGSSKEDSKNV